MQHAEIQNKEVKNNVNTITSAHMISVSHRRDLLRRTIKISNTDKINSKIVSSSLPDVESMKNGHARAVPLVKQANQ